MRILAFLSVAASSAALIAATPALADSRPAPRMGGGWQGGSMPRPTTPRPGGWTGSTPRPGGWHGGTPRPGGWHGGTPRSGHGSGHGWGGQVGGRWWGGSQAPGGWGGYHRPFRGFRVPNYWIAPSFYIGNYGSYGWPAPQSGYGWSRYYDDAVLIDGNGNVYDTRYGVDWDRYDRGPVPSYVGDGDGGYDDGPYDDDARDDRGAPSRPYPIETTGNGTWRGTWRGTWTGSYDNGPVQQYEGEYSGVYDRNGPRDDDYGDDRPGGYGAPYAAPGPDRAPPPRVDYDYSGSSYGYGYGAPTVTTVTVHSAPVVTTTTTTFVEEVVYTAPRAKPVRKWKPKPRPRCTCR